MESRRDPGPGAAQYLPEKQRNQNGGGRPKVQGMIGLKIDLVRRRVYMRRFRDTLRTFNFAKGDRM